MSLVREVVLRLMKKFLGRIQSARFGFGGYDNAMIGISWTLSWPGSQVSDFWGSWAGWDDTIADNERKMALGNAMMRFARILKEAKKTEVNQMVGVPIEITLNDQVLHEWRVLTEVL